MKISLWLDYSPPQYKVSKNLGDLIGVDTGTRTTILGHLWDYIKESELQDQADPTVINLNKDLARVLGGGQKSMPIHELPSALRLLLSPPDPYVFMYTVKLDRPESTADVYDVKVAIPQDWVQGS